MYETFPLLYLYKNNSTWVNLNTFIIIYFVKICHNVQQWNHQNQSV
jgi:hypothetical protein